MEIQFPAQLRVAVRRRISLTSSSGFGDRRGVDCSRAGCEPASALVVLPSERTIRYWFAAPHLVGCHEPEPALVIYRVYGVIPRPRSALARAQAGLADSG